MLTSISEIQSGLGRMSAGKLDESLVVRSSDAFGEIAGAPNGMQASPKAKIAADHEVVSCQPAGAQRPRQGVQHHAGRRRPDRHCNDAVLGMLRQAETDIRKELPAFSVEGPQGRNFDVFHKNPLTSVISLPPHRRASPRVNRRPDLQLIANLEVQCSRVRPDRWSSGATDQ